MLNWAGIDMSVYLAHSICAALAWCVAGSLDIQSTIMTSVGWISAQTFERYYHKQSLSSKDSRCYTTAVLDQHKCGNT